MNARPLSCLAPWRGSNTYACQSWPRCAHFVIVVDVDLFRRQFSDRIETHFFLVSSHKPYSKTALLVLVSADSATPEESVLSQHRASFVSDDGSQSATIKNLLPRTTYEIYVAASNDIGTSRPSKTVNVTTKVDRKYCFSSPATSLSRRGAATRHRA